MARKNTQKTAEKTRFLPLSNAKGSIIGLICVFISFLCTYTQRHGKTWVAHAIVKCAVPD
jgi:hypothetical protein